MSRNMPILMLAWVMAVGLAGGAEVREAHQRDRQRTHFAFKKRGKLISRPKGLAKPGPFYTTLVKMGQVDQFPYEYALYFSTDHDADKGQPEKLRSTYNTDQNARTNTIALSLPLFFLLPICSVPAAQVNVTYTFADKHVETATCPLVQEGPAQRFRLIASAVPAGVRQIEVIAEFASAKTGEDGYFVMPNGFLGTFRQHDGEQLLRGNLHAVAGV